MSVIFLESILLLALIVIAIVLITGESLLSTAIIYCAFSFLAMMLYIVVGAADVAFTEAVIGTVSTVYFVIAIKSIHTVQKKKKGKARDEKE